MNNISDVATSLAAALPGPWTTDHTLAAPILHGPDGERFRLGWENGRPGGFAIHPHPPSGIRDAWTRVETRLRPLPANESDPAVDVAHRMTSGLLHHYREALAQAIALDELWRRDTTEAEELLDTLLAAARLTHHHRESREHEVTASFCDDDRAGEIIVSRTHNSYVCFTVKTPHQHALRYAELLGRQTRPDTSAASAATHKKDDRS